MPACALREKRAGDARRQRRPPGSRATSRSTHSADGDIVARSRLFARSRHVRRGSGGARAGLARRSALERVCIRRPATPTRNSTSWCGGWRGAVSWNIGSARARRRGSGRRRAADRRLLAAAPQLGDADMLVLSRFAYLRRRGNDMVLESPRAGALFRICDPKIAAAWPCCRRRNRSSSCAGRRVFRGSSFSPCWSIARSCSRSTPRSEEPAAGRGRRQSRALGLSRSSVPRPQHRRPARQPARRHLSLCRRDRSRCRRCGRAWPGKADRPGQVLGRADAAIRRPPKLLRERHSTRNFDDQRPITLAELAQFLDGAARVLSTRKRRSTRRRRRPALEYAVRPYPSAGAQLRARALSRRQHSARDWRAASIITTPAGTRWRRSRSRAQQLDALLAAPHLPWARPPRRRS